MAFFLTRSALCIGGVAVAASGIGPLAGALDGGARGAAGEVGRACLASAACIRAASIAGAAALGPATRGTDAPPLQRGAGKAHAPARQKP